MNSRDPIARLREVLRLERSALAALDFPALAVLALEKPDLIAALESAPIDRTSLRVLRAEAFAQHALLADLLEAYRRVLHVQPAGTYDARARVRAAEPDSFGKEV